MHQQPRIIHDVGRDRDFFLVIVQAIAAADHQSVLEESGTPGEPELWTDVILLRGPCVSLVDRQASQVIRSCAWRGHKHIVLLRRERTEVGPAQPKIKRQVWSNFEIVLNKEAQDILAVVLTKSGREAGCWVEACIFRVRSVIKEVPHVEEGVVWHATPGALLQVKQACGLATKLNRVVPENFGGHIFVRVCPLIQDTANIGSELIDVRVAGEATDLANRIGGESNRRLRIGTDFVPSPSGGIGAKLVQETGRKRVIPEYGIRVVHLLVMEKVILPGWAV